MESKKQKNKQNKTHRYREQIGGYWTVRGRGVNEVSEGANCMVPDGNQACRDAFVVRARIELWCHTPEANTMLHTFYLTF